ncbi:MAG: type VI secretion system protein TssA [Pyrinomonadaceae bacterium]
MSEELRISPVIDLDALLQPISGENPSGENLRYSGIYDEIAEARRADDDLNQGDWKTELKLSDFGRVIDLAVPALTSRSKDLQVGVWLTDAITRKKGFPGFRDGLVLLAGLQDKFWETLHPEIDEGDMEGRANAISWMDINVANAVRRAPFTGSAGYSFIDWEDSKRFDFPENMESVSSVDQEKFAELRAQADRERRVTSAMWASERAQTRRADCEQMNFTLDECWAALNALNLVIEEKYDRNQMPGLTNLKKALDDAHTQLKVLLEEKRLEEPGETEEIQSEQDGEASTESDGTAKPAGTASGAIQNRKDALKRLDEIAAFFQKSEPHSPVSYLVQRAVKWGNMPLESWLQDVIKDQSVLFQLRETLGFTASEGSSESSY